jgi:hypothetical protein
MTDKRITEAELTDMRNVDQTGDSATDFRRTVPTEVQSTPGVRHYPNWSKWFGYYKNIPDVQAVVNKLAAWTVGRGYEVPEKSFLEKFTRKPSRTKEILERISGCGVDTFNTILKNQLRAAFICGDSFAEIVRNKRQEFINLKPINPGSIVIKSNARGVIIGYEQIVIPYGEGGLHQPKTIKFPPGRIFHLSWNRLGDEPHGRSIMEPLEDVIDSKNEAMKDMRIVFHRYVKPLVVSEVDTDDETEIKAFREKLDRAVRYMENMVIPMGTARMDRISIPQYSTLDPLPWLKLLQIYFITAAGVPEIILGHGGSTTEASAKILYLSFQQTVEDIQLWVEEQCRKQLKIEIELNFPENIGPELAMDIQKERNMNNFSETGGGNFNAVNKFSPGKSPRNQAPSGKPGFGR